MIFSKFTQMVDELTIQLVSNYVIDASLKKETEKTVINRVFEPIPKTKAKKLIYTMTSTMDVIAKVVENEHDQVRRYGHPMLDIAREINRYSKPNVKFAGQGRAGQRKNKFN